MLEVRQDDDAAKSATYSKVESPHSNKFYTKWKWWNLF